MSFGRIQKAMAGDNASGQKQMEKRLKNVEASIKTNDVTDLTKRVKALEDTLKAIDIKELSKRVKTLETTVGSLLNASKSGGGGRETRKDIEEIQKKIEKQEKKMGSVELSREGEKKFKALEKRKEMLENAIKALNAKEIKRHKEYEAEKAKKYR